MPQGNTTGETIAMGDFLGTIFGAIFEAVFGKTMRRNPGRTLAVMAVVVVLLIAGAFAWMFVRM